MALFGVHLAQVLTTLLTAACVLLGLLVLLTPFRQQARKAILQPVYARNRVRRAIGRPLPVDLTPVPSRDPPSVPPLRAWEPDPDRNR